MDAAQILASVITFKPVADALFASAIVRIPPLGGVMALGRGFLGSASLASPPDNTGIQLEGRTCQRAMNCRALLERDLDVRKQRRARTLQPTVRRRSFGFVLTLQSESLNAPHETFG
jgi:hypothetical protein